MKKYSFDVFLSYSHVDQAWVDKLKLSLEDRGVSVWRDKENIRPGDFFAEALEKGIEASSTVVMVITAASLKSSWVSEEYYRALSLANNQKSRIIPCILGEVVVPGFLSSREYINFTNEANFDANVDRLIWPGITGKFINATSFDHDNWNYDSLHRALQTNGVYCGRLSETRMFEWFYMQDLRRKNSEGDLSSKGHNCQVLFMDLFSDELPTKSSIDFILKCRSSHDGINENIVFVFYHEPGWLGKLRELGIAEDLVNRFSHYFVVEKTDNEDKLRKKIRAVWTLVQRDLLQKIRQ